MLDSITYVKYPQVFYVKINYITWDLIEMSVHRLTIFAKKGRGSGWFPLIRFKTLSAQKDKDACQMQPHNHLASQNFAIQ